ncbi:MAG: ATP-dependent zinc metalloprotease FtsH [Campylobacterales bacterium]|nr:ATP-dependent zinc metalloprotease FtsH [Campylobacterales bacterium]
MNRQNNDNRPDGPDNNNFFNQNPLLIFAIFSVVAILIFKYVASPEAGMTDGSSGFGSNSQRSVYKKIGYYDFKELVKSGQIEEVSIGKTTLKAVSNQGGLKTVYTIKRIHPDNDLLPILDSNKVKYSGFSEDNWLSDLLFGWILPIFIFFGIWILLTSRMQKNLGGGMLGMGSSKKMVNSEKPDTKFDDMAGNKEAKEEVKEVVDFLQHPDRYLKLGAKIPKGILLVGPPGTGKTLLAKAVAGEASVPFFSVSASSFIEMFVGVGAARVRDLFEQAKKDAPSIVFIDEIDALGKNRSAGGMGGNDEREQTLNQLLAEMDGFASDEPVIILAATNRPEVLDPALLRPGRFDRQVLVDKPDYQGRLDILQVHVKNIEISPKANLKEIATMTAGLAGADLANVINEATLLAGRKNKDQVEQSDLKEAVERSIAGLEKKSRRISEKEKNIVAYHESGHALIAQITKGANKVNKVSIVPRGMAALGYTLNTPEENRYLMQKHELIAEVDVLLGGRAAEELFVGEISTGASNDLERATDIIKSMVMMYGMSDVAGLMVMEKQNSKFLGGGLSQSKDYSEEMAQKLDKYLIELLDERYTAVKESLEKYRDAMETMTAELRRVEVIGGSKVTEILREFEEKNGIDSEWQKELEEKEKASQEIADNAVLEDKPKEDKKEDEDGENNN